MDNRNQIFCIADLYIKIQFEESHMNHMGLLPSFEPFATDERPENLLSVITVDDNLTPIKKEYRERIGKFDTGNGETVVDKLPDGGYQYIIKDIYEQECCLLQTNKEFSVCRCALNGNERMRGFGLNNAMMLIFAFAGCWKQALLIHASVVRHKEKAYAFIAKSGTGKSTHSNLWLNNIPGCDLVNDDNPVVRVINDEVFLFGSPWSGKTPCYRQLKVKLGAIVRIDRAKKNSIDKESPVAGFASLLPSCSSMKWDKDIFGAICDNVTMVLERVNIYTLHCLPDKEAAELCHQTVTQ